MEEESKFFPLCMLNLYKVLQMTNRLSHNDRFDFSLFIKGIGISLNDSLKFWEDAYSKQHASCSRCTHDWQKNEKRYIYGIRHLYGLEGSRKKLRTKVLSISPGTKSEQGCVVDFEEEKTLCATEDGGCPFKNFDDNSLRRALKKLLPNKDDEVEVMIYERKESPGESCKLFYNIILENFGNESVDRVVNFQNPVEYYVSLKNTALSSNSSNTNSNGAQNIETLVFKDCDKRYILENLNSEKQFRVVRSSQKQVDTPTNFQSQQFNLNSDGRQFRFPFGANT
ncbi:hypothetical protein NQ317_005562 [Molorchus minor]|uniref:DNA primase large subunit C-terminal domain-containing protein n=1 Tax=Molorchus minor TaxID=1323400 RepID=A0ABQ9IX72_9CUCU|nr:hypothetical protein NQ317_005562 [Molorchus minor]